MANVGVLGRIFQRKPVELIHAETDHGELKRTLGALNLVLLGIGCIIGTGIFVLTGHKFSAPMVAAILCIAGYSINETVVVFDRIRENIKLLRRDKLADIVNKSINQTLSRTILTAGLTFLTVLALFLFGGEVLHGFSFALVIGILIGTYSSIAIAAPILVAYQEWRGGRGKPPVAMPLRSGTGNRPTQPKEKVKV